MRRHRFDSPGIGSLVTIGCFILSGCGSNPAPVTVDSSESVAPDSGAATPSNATTTTSETQPAVPNADSATGPVYTPTGALTSWHRWRGPTANGVAPQGNPPLNWDESTNIQWKVKLPGYGSGTPIVWQDKIYLLTAVDTGKMPEGSPPAADEKSASGGGRGRRGFRMSTPTPKTEFEFRLLCLDRQTGETVWSQVARKQVPFSGHHPSHGFASSSAVTDGKLLYASFGSYGIYCYNLAGELQWELDLGDMQTRAGFGEGASPALHEESLVVTWDHEGESFIVCLNALSGEEIWRQPRDERTTWATPLIVEHEGTAQVITNAQNRTRSYNLADGALLWECGGQAGNPIATPVVKDGTVYCMTGFRGYAVYALPLSARGDISDTDKIVWKYTDNGPYVASPVLYDDLLYFTKERRGVLSCVRADTGEFQFENQRLPGFEGLYASLSAAAGKIYIVSRNGTTVVLKHGSEFEVLATNQLAEGIDASPVIVGNQLLLRGAEHLYAISEQ
jgi:outer membrane protein assembly factor BamB